MAILDFPPVEKADENGLLALGGDLEIESLLLAYSRGIFPWPISDEFPLAWFSPDPRGVLFFDRLRIPRTLKKFLNNNPYEIKFNTNFEAVIMNCALVTRSDQDSTWITDDIINAYINLYRQGFAYSVETYFEDKLVGGLYGVCINKFYSGESMFYKMDNASKIALIALMYRLNENGINWIDTQMVTPVIASMGGSSVRRKDYLEILKQSLVN